MSVRPYRGSFEPIGMAHPMTSHIEPLAAQARPVCSRGHRVKHDSRMLGPATAPGLSVRYGPQGLSLAAKLGLVPLSLGGVLGHHRLVEPLLDIAAEAVRGQVGEVEGLYRHRCQDLHGPSAAVDLHHQRTERLIVFGAQRRQVPAGIRELLVDVGHLPQVLVGRRQVVGRDGARASG